MKLETERDGLAWVHAARALAVVSAYSALGLFEKLRGGPMRRADLPADRRALDITIPVLVHVGVLATSGDLVALTPAAERLLDLGAMPSPFNLMVLGDLAKMADLLREGGPVRDAQGNRRATKGGTVDDPAQTEAFLDMLYRLSDEPSRTTYVWLSPRLPAQGAVLDLGGGHGRYARVFADAGHEVTLFDQPNVVPLARKRHGDALAYLEGDFHTIESFGGPYDLVLMCNIVHGESDEANASIIARAAKSLRPGGTLAIRDMFLDELGSNPREAVFFGLMMLMHTEKGASPTVAAARRWCEAAGLEKFEIAVLETHQIVTARRPG